MPPACLLMSAANFSQHMFNTELDPSARDTGGHRSVRANRNSCGIRGDTGHLCGCRNDQQQDSTEWWRLSSSPSISHLAFKNVRRDSHLTQMKSVDLHERRIWETSLWLSSQEQKSRATPPQTEGLNYKKRAKNNPHHLLSFPVSRQCVK